MILENFAKVLHLVVLHFSFYFWLYICIFYFIFFPGDYARG